MRIGVIGTGAVGGTIAALLDRGGHEVEVTSRGTQLDVIRANGLALGGAWGAHLARLTANETLTVTPEVAFVCTKAQDAASAIEANRDALAKIPVVIVQNGLSGLADARRLLPQSDCLGALALYAASYLTAGTVTVTTPGPTYLGAGDLPSETAERCAAILGAVMPAVATDNFTGMQWSKLVVNQVNAMPAITGMSAQSTIADRRLRYIITASMKEAIQVGIASGVRFGTIKPMTDRMLRMIAAAPVSLGQVVPLRMAKAMGATPNPGSTLQSIRRGQPTEIDYLNGAVVDAARRVGMSAPVNAALVSLVHEVERTGEFVSPADVVARVTL